MSVAAVVMAAGLSKRMNSAVPKVLHKLMGKPLIEYALEVVAASCTCTPVIVVGHGAEDVKKVVHERAEFALQKEQLGTADAVNAARGLLQGKADLILVISADMPLLRTETISHLIEIQKNNPGPISMLTVTSSESHGFGRVVRSLNGQVMGIVEEKVASTGQLAINEFNASIYCFSAEWLWKNLTRVKKSPAGEYFLTDLVGMATGQGLSLQVVKMNDPEEALGSKLIPSEFCIHRSISSRSKSNLPAGFRNGIFLRRTRFRMPPGDLLRYSLNSKIVRYLFIKNCRALTSRTVLSLHSTFLATWTLDSLDSSDSFYLFPRVINFI